MPKYIIERRIPQAGELTGPELKAISEQSWDVLRKLGPEIQWIQSYVTEDALFSIFISPDEDAVRVHARLAGFPADRVMEIKTIIDPLTAE